MREPIFKTVLGKDWDNLGAIVQKHYALTPYSNNHVRVDGVMSEVTHSLPAKLLIPFGLLFGAIVPYRARMVPVSVHYNSNVNNANLYWDRVFQIKPQKNFRFKSYMVQMNGNEVIEYVRFGVGARLLVTVEEGALVFRSIGYIWRILGYNVPIPAELIFGSAYVEERPVNKDTFSMMLELRHPLFGFLFRYNGRFSIAENNIDFT